LLAKAELLAGGLTQIDLRKLELARAIAAQPKLLIADESMAGLATSETDEILALLLQLNSQGIAVIMIEHIMRAVSAFSQRLVVLAAGKKIADGPTQEVLRDPLVERIYLGD
jgi:branched-chain amino acid transport system ATP-binding protein